MDLLQLLKGHYHVKCYSADCWLFNSNQDNDYFGVIVSGMADLSMDSLEERPPITLRRLFAGDAFGLNILLDEQIQHVSVTSLTKVKVAEISVDKFRWLLSHELQQYQAEFYQWLAQKYCSEFHALMTKIETAYSRPIPERMLVFLRLLSSFPDAERVYNGSIPNINITKLAQWCRCSREMAGRVLGKMEAEGLVRKQGYRYVLIEKGNEINDIQN